MNYPINNEIKSPIQPEIQFREKLEANNDDLDKKIPKDGTVTKKPISSLIEAKNFLKESLKISGGTLLLATGAALTVALLPLVAGGAATGVTLGTIAALLKGKDIHESIKVGALAGVAIGSIAGPGIALLGVNMLNSSKSEVGKNISSYLPKEIPSQIRKQLEAFNKTSKAQGKESVTFTAHQKEVSLKDSGLSGDTIVAGKKMSDWVGKAQTDPNGFAEELYENDKLEKNNPVKISEEEFSKLLGDLSKKLDVGQFGKVVSGAFRSEIKGSEHSGNLMRLTASSVEGKVFKQFRLAYLQSSLEKSDQWRILATDIYKSDPLFITDENGIKQINNQHGQDSGVSDANKLVEQSLGVTSGMINNGSEEMNVFKDILKTLKQDVDQKFPGANDGKMDAGTSAVSSIIFLRFINPGLLNKNMELIAADKADNKSPNIKAPTLTLTKIMQNMANGVNFGEKESYMIGFNASIEKNQPLMDNLIKDAIS